MEHETILKKPTSKVSGRRDFFKLSSLALAAGIVAASCNDDDDNGGNNHDNQLPGLRNGVFDFGGGDLGILTYAYALEQMAAEFYTRVVTNTGFTSTFNADEQAIMMDLYGHEIVHREFFEKVLGDSLPDSSSQLLPGLSFAFGNVNFGDRTPILNMAGTLEDMGIAAYNGAGNLLSDEATLNLAGKIASVEGRHASVIRSMIDPDSATFAPTPLDPALLPSQVISQINSMNLISTDFTANYLS